MKFRNPLSSSSSSSNSSPLCIGLLILVLCLQLYILSLWFSPNDQPPQFHTKSTSSSSSSSSNRELAAFDPSLISSSSSSPEGSEVITAIRLLQKYIRANRERFPTVSDDSLLQIEAPPSSGEHHHEHKHIDVGEGIKLGEARTDGEHAGHDHEHLPGDTHSEETLRGRDIYHEIWLNTSIQWAERMLNPDAHHSVSKAERERIELCLNFYAKWPVVPDVTWNNMPDEHHETWESNKCNDLISVRTVAKYIQDNSAMYDRLMPVPKNREPPRPEKGMEERVIAMCVSMTTRGLNVGSLNDLSVVHDLLPTFVETVEVGFEYWFYLGFDSGDPYLDNESHLQEIGNWFNTNVRDVLKGRGITSKLVTSSWENPYKKPGPAFNYITGLAYADGATYIYRVNDDTRFETPWANVMVSELLAMGAPYGVVGPACGQGATHILVVDFVHRTHHDVFPTHYPPSLMGWFSDNWISSVYGRKRTKRVNQARITHMLGKHGTRYNIYGNWEYFRGEVVHGRARLEQYLSHTEGMDTVLKEYREDTFTFVTRR